ncbi:MAG: ParB/RepB/Spo0J family partition protein [Thermodesulfobacteriota bacterium]
MLGKKKALGRGLGALIGEGTITGIKGGAGKADSTGEDKYFLCDTGKINPGKFQPRKTFNEDSLKELSASIKEKGVIEPLIVKCATSGSGYELVAGERRLRASVLAGIKKVPVVQIDVTDEESLELAIIENIQREDLNAIEEAEAYKTLSDFGLTQDEVAKKVGKQRATVANYLRLLKLPGEVKSEISKGTLSMGHARAICSLDTTAAQRELARRVIKKGLSVRETEALAAKGLKTGSAVRKKPVASLEVALAEDDLRRVLGTKVKIKERNGKGRFEIEYYSADERERLIELFKTL